MEHHRFANLWPLMTGADFAALKADIAAHGQRMPIITYQGQVLDGRNRERACEALGIAPRYEEAKATTDAEARKLVMSLNQHRRHLTMEERAFAAAEMATLEHGSNQHLARQFEECSIGHSSTSGPIPIDAAAAKMHISVGTARRAKRILVDGTPEDKEDVLRGKVKLHTKDEEVAKRKRERERAAAATKSRRPREGPRLVMVNPPPLRSPTRQEVDPEFTGTSIEFVDKYGHVQVMTAAEYATMRFGIWAANMKSSARTMRDLPGWPVVDHNWLRQPKPSDIVKMADALAFLRPKLAEAEKLLERAQCAAEQVA